MADLADAHGSGPCGGDSMQVQLLLSAPKRWLLHHLFFYYMDISEKTSPIGLLISRSALETPLCSLFITTMFLPLK